MSLERFFHMAQKGTEVNERPLPDQPDDEETPGELESLEEVSKDLG